MILYELDEKIKEHFNEIVESPEKIKEIINTAPLHILMFLASWLDFSSKLVRFWEPSSDKIAMMNECKSKVIKHIKRELQKLSK